MTRPTLRLVLVAAIALAVTVLFLSRFVLFELNLRRLGAPVALALAEAIAIVGVGRGARVLLRRLMRSDEPDQSKIRSDLVAGYPLFGAICFLAGLISTHPVFMAVILIAGVVGGTYALRFYTRKQNIVLALSFSTWLALAVLLIAAGAGLVIAQLPAVTLDEVAYHLAAPRIWVQEGRIVDLPLLSHSYFPFGIESAAIPLLSILGADGAIAAHFVHLMAAFATAFLIYSWLQSKVSAGFALAGTAALVTTPALLVTAGWYWNEWPLLGICVALLTELDPPRPDRSAVAALIAAGLMTKYSFPLFALVVLLARREKTLLKPALLGALAGSVFFIRNLILTGNPLAPFFAALAPDVTLFRSDFGGYLFDGDFLDESLGITVIVFALAALVALPADRFLRFTTLGLMTATIVAALARPSSRLLLPFLIPLAMIGVASVLQLRQVRWALVVLASLQLFVTLVYLSRMQPFQMLTGRASEAEYLASQRRSFASVFWLDSQLPPESRTLVMGVNELFWFSKPVRGGGNFDSNRLNEYVHTPDLAERLRRDRISHIALAGDGLRVGSLASQKEQERVTVLDPQTAINLREFLRGSARLVASRGNDAVYALR